MILLMFIQMLGEWILLVKVTFLNAWHILIFSPISPGWSILKIACDLVILCARNVNINYISSKETHFERTHYVLIL